MLRIVTDMVDRHGDFPLRNGAVPGMRDTSSEIASASIPPRGPIPVLRCIDLEVKLGPG